MAGTQTTPRSPVVRINRPRSAKSADDHLESLGTGGSAAFPIAQGDDIKRLTRRRIGLLGGSFNPAHEGHRAISIEGIRRLDLDQVWWLVSPQNPLKSTRDMAPLKARLASAENMIAGHPKLIVHGFGTEDWYALYCGYGPQGFAQ